MTSENRRRRCVNAIESVLEFVRKKDGDPKVVRRLKKRFLSPAGILESNVHTLTKENLSVSDAQLLTLIPNLTRYAQRMSYGPHPRLNTLADAAAYLKTLFIGVSIEQFYLLCLDASGKLIECRLLQKGTLDETPFYLGHLLQAVVTTRAQAIVLCHNHPGGTMRPSQADLKCTLDALLALYPLHVCMLDHIIIADGEAVSLHDCGFVPRSYWSSQAPDNRLLIHWLDRT